MHPDDPFPLENVPSPVRHAMLEVFKGRRPSVHEVAEIPDSYWLATPAIGRKLLQTIRAVSNAPRSAADISARPQLTDAELLDRLESLREELQFIQAMVKAKIRKPARNRDGFRRHGDRGSRSGSLSGRPWSQKRPEGLSL
jgi:hypothetical protein